MELPGLGALSYWPRLPKQAGMDQFTRSFTYHSHLHRCSSVSHFHQFHTQVIQLKRKEKWHHNKTCKICCGCSQ